MGTYFKFMPGRFDYLTDAVEGLQRSGVPLVGYQPEGALWTVPGSGDDLGIYYAVPQLMRATGLSLERSIDIVLGGSLLLASILGLILIFLGWKSVSVRAVGVVSVLLIDALSYSLGDVYVFQTVAALIAGPMALLLIKNVRPLGGGQMAALVALGVGFALCNEFRSGAGIAALLMVGAAIALRGHEPIVRRIFLIVLLVIGFVPVLGWHHALVSERNAFLSGASKDFSGAATDHHLMWHSIYIGFGFLNNPYGITYVDGVATRLVKSNYPGIIGDTDVSVDYVKYERALKHETLLLIRNHPFFVLRTIAAKVGVVLWFASMSFAFGLFYCLRRRPVAIEASFLPAIAFGFLPGVLVMPIPEYVLGGIVAAILYGFACFAYAHDPVHAI